MNKLYCCRVKCWSFLFGVEDDRLQLSCVSIDISITTYFILRTPLYLHSLKWPAVATLDVKLSNSIYYLLHLILKETWANKCVNTGCIKSWSVFIELFFFKFNISNTVYLQLITTCDISLAKTTLNLKLALSRERLNRHVQWCSRQSDTSVNEQ